MRLTELLAVSASSSQGQELSGILGLATQVMEALSEWGVGLLTFIETVFPPIPSEVILPLAGFLASQGRMNFVLVLVTATLGGFIGALLLYWLGRVVGEERSVRLLSKLPLVDREDFEKAAGWLHRHGRSAVFFGRLIPGVRSLISLPAGSTRMPLVTFTIFTVAGTLVWNGLLVGLGAALGSQYELIEQYSGVLDYVVYAAIAGVLVWLIVRRVRRVRAQRDG
ncbi:membrane protein DedA with SNARE-associated domain [Diaminobutyricimonas aerilata]|uniref:Membrane protein DedA with SNARE-associated domain n=1 Tax=Diaminobutyricimonas aerilata TaxID=1162967 RepID=A0A2M9CIX2_9MICO|nr:DedA family protein [Diaminobutyricimonas aerilata]PJJ71839.1 membrane protein DedA with SNARE-associated domain [Diaminobutyricimonas aerilata]